MSIATLRRRASNMLAQLEKHAKPVTHAFILLDNAELAPETISGIGMYDIVYVKRIVLIPNY